MNFGMEGGVDCELGNGGYSRLDWNRADCTGVDRTGANSIGVDRTRADYIVGKWTGADSTGHGV